MPAPGPSLALATSRPAARADAPEVREALGASGRPLDGQVRAEFEGRFGRDFGDVRVHTDARAARSADAAGADAYTVGTRIVFARGRYAPETSRGAALLAHELTHVAQQSDAPGATLAADAAEAEAERNAAAVPRGGPLPVAGTGSPPGGLARQEAGEEDPEKARDTADVAQLLRVAERAREVTEPTRRGLAHVEFVYRALAKYFPAYSDRVAGVGYYDSVAELQVILEPPSRRHFTIRVGRNYLANTTAATLPYRVAQLGRAVSDVLDPDQAGRERADGPKLSLEDALSEGAQVLAASGFGAVCGGATGADPGDGYDAREWKEKEGRREILVAQVEPWLAFAHLVQNLGKDVPSSTGGRTRWAFDCFGHVILTRIYAHWRTLDRTAFNARFNPLELGINSRINREWKQPIQSDRPGDRPYVMGEPEMSLGGGPAKWPKQRQKKSWDQLLADAPVGTQVTFGNQDAIEKCNKDMSLSFCNWRYENTTKLGPERYSAHDLGIVDRAAIERKMAEAVLGAEGKPLTDAAVKAYIRKWVFVSGMREPRPESV